MRIGGFHICADGATFDFTYSGLICANRTEDLSLLTEGEWADGASNSVSLKAIDLYVLCGRHIRTLVPSPYESRHLRRGVVLFAVGEHALRSPLKYPP